MPTYLHTIQTWNPPYCQTQAKASEKMQAQFDNKRMRRILSHIYKQSAIDTRYTCVSFDNDAYDPLFAGNESGQWLNPGTKARNRVYRDISKAASVDLARDTLAASPYEAENITHLITVSCSGFYNPGPDYYIIQSLGLSIDVQRYHLGFMGCYAAFPALRLADSICKNNPDSLVMIQCLELCSLHVQLDLENAEDMVAGSLFSDGAGCVLLSGHPPAAGRKAYRIDQLASTLIPEGEDAMVWEIGDRGFEIVLSGYVPHIIGDNIRQTILPFIESAGSSQSEIQTWAVHPGGKAILDRVSEALDLPADALDLSRDILRRYGNMSSATVLFILAQALANDPDGPCAAMAFGPGLTVEMGLLQLTTGKPA